MQDKDTNTLQTLLEAVLEMREHPEAKDCIEYVCVFLNDIYNDDILRGCTISWDDTTKGFLLLWDDTLPKYLFKADILICKDYYHYNFILRDKYGNYLGSDGTFNSIDNYCGYNWLTGECDQHKGKPFWRNVINHLEEVYG